MGKKDLPEMIDNLDIMNADVYGDSNRFITTELIDSEWAKTGKKENSLLKKIDSCREKYLLAVVKRIILEEMKKDYYENEANIKEIVNIDTHLMENFIYGKDYIHVENLVIWQNGFYNFNCFNFNTPSMRKRGVNYQWKYGGIIPKKDLYIKEYK